MRDPIVIAAIVTGAVVSVVVLANFAGTALEIRAEQASEERSIESEIERSNASARRRAERRKTAKSILDPLGIF